MKKIITETKTVIINTKTNEQFVTYTESIELDLQLNSRTVITLTREDGSTKTIAESTFKRYYKKTEITVETEVEVDEPIPAKETKPLTKHQKDAKHNIYYGYGWVVGGHENDLSDNGTEMPPIEVLFEEVYDEVMSCTFDAGFCDTKGAPIAMRFAGKQFILDYIAKLFREDGYEVPAELTKVPEKKSGAKRGYNDVTTCGDEEVIVRAFTGMLIGVFAISEQNAETISVKTVDGKRTMTFSRKNGIEINAKKPQFANRIDL